MKKIFLYFISFLSFISCNNNSTNNEETKNIALTPSDTILLNLPNDVGYKEYFEIVNLNGIERIGVSLMRKNRILIFDKKSGSILKDIKVESEGNNGVGIIQSMKYINNDSIFLTKRHSNEIYLINSNSEVKKKWFLSDAKNKKIENRIATNVVEYPLTFKNKSIYCSKIIEAYQGEPIYLNDNNLIKFNLSDSTIENNIFSFPEEYKKEKKYSRDTYNYSYIIRNDNKIVVSFPINSNIYLYSDTGLLAKYPIKSKYVDDSDKVPETDLLNDNWGATENFEIQKGSYKWLKYDSKRDYIIRLVLHKSELYDTNGNKNRLYDKEFSLQIINNKFELIGEQKFPANTFDVWNIIPVEEGLLISINNDKNPELEEDKVKFVLYKYSNE